MMAGVLLVASASIAGPPGREFAHESYTQEIRFAFRTEAAAQAAMFEVCPLFEGHEHAISSRWDDNCENNLEMKKRLDTRGVKATWYLNVAPFEQNPGAEDYVDTARGLLENGHSIGAHSYSHPYITYASRNAMFHEIAAARIVWEALLDTAVHSYSFSYIDYRSEAEGAAVQSDLIRLLERAGFYHLAEFKTFDDLLPSEMLLSVIMPPENNDFGTFRAAVDWATSTPEVVSRFPGISHSMHAWYGTSRSPYGWDELERRLDYANAVPNTWRCNHNQYAAYRYQFLQSALEESRRDCEVLLRLTRPTVGFLDEPTPLTVAVEANASDIVAAACETAPVTRSERSTSEQQLYNVAHDRDRRTPVLIGRVENPTNRNSVAPTDFDPDFPWLRALLWTSPRGLRLRLANDSASPLQRVRVTYRLPLMWEEGVRRIDLVDLRGGAALEDSWSPTPRTEDPKYAYGRAYLVAQVDFEHEGGAGRLYATCFAGTRSDTSFPKEGFVVLGPIEPSGFDADAFGEALTAAGAPEVWSLPDGTCLEWRDNSADGPVDQALLDPEVIRTLGSWYELRSLLYVLRSFVHSEKAQTAMIRSSPDDVRLVYLNGRRMEGGALPLRAGRNDLVVVYHCSVAGGSPRHAGAWLRLAHPETGARLTDVRYERPTCAVPEANAAS